MKKFSTIFLAVFLTLTIVSWNNPVTKQTSFKGNEKNSKLEVYYFHYSHRCATCLSVEEVTKNILTENYPAKMRSGKISFKSVDMDEKGGKELAIEMRVSGQTLLFTYENHKKNLTNDAFLYARSNPEKLQEKIKKTVENMME